jgi:peroxiredoxin
MKLRTAVFITAGLLIMLLLGVTSSTTAGQSGIRPAPDFKLKSLEGEDLVLSELKGRVVVVNFWATWCGPCRVEIPHLKSLYEKYNSEGLEIIGISLDRGGERVVKPYVEKHEIKYPITMGNMEVVSKYGGIEGVPTTFIIDREGNIRYKWVGYRKKEDFVKVIIPLLGSKIED